MGLDKLVDSRVFRDKKEFVSGQIDGVTELINSSLDFGLKSTASTFKKMNTFGFDVLEATGIYENQEMKESLEEDIEKERLLAKEIRAQQESYLDKEDGIARNIGLGFISGMAQMSTNAPEIALNIASGIVVSKVAGTLATTALSKAVIGITGETMENVAYSFFEKKNFLKEDFTQEELLGTIQTSVAMGAGLYGLKRVAGKLIADSMKPVKTESNSSKNAKKGTTTDTISPEEVAQKFKEDKVNKLKSTGVGTDDLEIIETAKRYDGKTAEEIDLISKKEPSVRTPEENIALEKFAKNDFDLDVEASKNILKEEIKQTNKIENILEENQNKISESINEIIEEPNIEIKKINEAIELENKQIELDNVEMKKQYESKLEAEELRILMQDMEFESKTAKKNKDLARKLEIDDELLEIDKKLNPEKYEEPIKFLKEGEEGYLEQQAEFLFREKKTPSLDDQMNLPDVKKALEKELKEINARTKKKITKPKKKVIEEPIYKKPKEFVEETNKHKVESEAETLQNRKKEIETEMESRTQKIHETLEKDILESGKLSKAKDLRIVEGEVSYNGLDLFEEMGNGLVSGKSKATKELVESIFRRIEELTGEAPKKADGTFYKNDKAFFKHIMEDTIIFEKVTPERFAELKKIDGHQDIMKSYLNQFQEMLSEKEISKFDDFANKKIALDNEFMEINEKLKNESVIEPKTEVETKVDTNTKAEVETAKTEPTEPVIKKEKTTEPKVEKQGFSSNKLQELGFITALKTVRDSLIEKGFKPSRGTFREQINIHITEHYKNISKKTKNFLAETLISREGNRILDFRETIDKIEAKGFKLADILMDTENGFLKELDAETGNAIMNFKKALGTLETNFKIFDKNFDIRKAIVSSRFSRNSFLNLYGSGLGLKADSNGNFNFKNISKVQLQKMKESFVFRNLEKFEGATITEKRNNAFKFSAKLIDELKHGGLRGSGGKKTLRNTAFHKFSMMNNVIDESLISFSNLSEVLGGSDFSKSIHMFSNLVEGLAEAKALKDTFGKDLENFTTSGSKMKKLFSEIFGSNFSADYITEIEGSMNYFKKKMGLTTELNHPVLDAADLLLSSLYIGKKPLLILRQIAEPVIASIHKGLAWENGLLSLPLTFVKDLKNSVKNVRLTEASEMYRIAVGGTTELLDEIAKEVDMINLKDAGTLIHGIKKIGKGVNDTADYLSFMKPFENYFNKTSVASALTSTKKWLGLGYDKSIEINPLIKQAFEKVGLIKEEFDFLSKHLADLDIVDSGNVYKKIKDLDFGELKEIYTKKYTTKNKVEKSFKLSDKQMALLLSDKFSKLQELVANTGRSTKANDLDFSYSPTLTMNLVNKANNFLKKSGFEAVRRAYEIIVSGSQHHGAGNPVNSVMAKNMLKLTLMTPLMFYANAINSSSRRILTSKDDIDTILEEEFSVLHDKYGELETVTNLLIKLGLEAPGEAFYMNMLVDGGYAASVVDTITKDLKKGNFNRTKKALKPALVKGIENRILE
ncbi:MAG: hypothetical protein ACRC0R_03975 [Cetobacterium sp.]